MRALMVSMLLAAAWAAPAKPAYPAITQQRWEITGDKDEQFKRDVDFFLATLFPDPAKVADLEAGARFGSEKVRHLLRDYLDPADPLVHPPPGRILARVFLALAWGGLKFCKESNDVEHLADWPWQLATALGHGQRIVFDLKGASSNELYSVLLFGEVRREFEDPFWRLAASHGFSWEDGDNGRLREVKYKKLKLFKALTDGFKGRHHGINVAFGGLGNPRLDDYVVGPFGLPLDPKFNYTLVSGQQHGHLYVHNVDHGHGARLEGALMLGLEGSAPLMTNMYGVSHNAGSAMADASNEVSVAGGRKLKHLLGADGPAEVGGKWVLYDHLKLTQLETLVKRVDAMDDGDEKKIALFKTLLSSDAVTAHRALEALLEERERGE